MHYLSILVHEMHTSIMATVDVQHRPVTCAIDLMDYDDQGIYFLTAKGKSFYTRLKHCSYLSLSALQDQRCISLQGEARELGNERIPDLFAKNPYMYTIYPTESSREALTVFVIENASGEYFDLAARPIFRERFTLGQVPLAKEGYWINDRCRQCGQCLMVCPQQCILTTDQGMRIEASHCLHCGRCLEVCPYDAVEKGRE